MAVKPLGSIDGTFVLADDGSSLLGVIGSTTVGPGHRSCNLIFVDYQTTIPSMQQDGSISFPYQSCAVALTYISTQTAGQIWELRCGPGTEPGNLTIRTQDHIIFVGHHLNATSLNQVTLTADLPNVSIVGYKNISVGDTIVSDGGSPNTAIIYTENAKRGSITQTGSSLVGVIDSGTSDSGFPSVLGNCTVDGDTIVTGPIYGTNILYDTGCTSLDGQSVYLSGCLFQAANISFVETLIIKNSDWGFDHPLINNNAIDTAIEAFLDAHSTLSWNDRLGLAPNNTFVTTDFGTSNERYSCNQEDRYYFGRVPVTTFRTDWNSPIATWGYLGSLPDRGISFTTGIPSEARASISQRKDWLLVQPSYDNTGLFLGSRQLLHPPGSVIFLELGPVSMDSYSQSPFVAADVMSFLFSEQVAGDIDLNNYVLFQLARTALDTWIVQMNVTTGGVISYLNNNTIIADTCPLSYLGIEQIGTIVRCFYSKDRESWKSIGSYDTSLSPLALDRVSIFLQAGQPPNCIFGIKEMNVYLSATI